MNDFSWGPDQTLVLADGRVLGYRTHGPVDGAPLMFMHGTPGSRYVLSEHDPLAQVPGIFLVTPERPGYGSSTPHPGRSLQSWAADVAALAQHLGLARYSVAGVSGGAPHTLACGYYNADRVASVFMLASPAPASLRASVSGMSLGNRLGLWVSRFAPAIVRGAIGSFAAAFHRDPEGFMQKVIAQLSEPDRILMRNEDFRQAMMVDMKEAYRQGSEAQYIDGQLAMTADTWGFPLADVRVPVFSWHGTEDSLIPVSAARALAKATRGMTLTVVAGAGHLLTEDRGAIGGIVDVLCNGACGSGRGRNATGLRQDPCGTPPGAPT